jgi:hypothetical protein
LFTSNICYGQTRRTGKIINSKPPEISKTKKKKKKKKSLDNILSDKGSSVIKWSTYISTG